MKKDFIINFVNGEHLVVQARGIIDVLILAWAHAITNDFKNKKVETVERVPDGEFWQAYDIDELCIKNKMMSSL